MSATIHTRTNPVLIDGVIAEIQAQMAQRVEWFNNIFGRVERLVKNVNGRTIYSANQYKGGNEYTLIAPDSGLGNFAFFVVDEPETMDYTRGDRTHFSTPFSLVVWVDMRTIASGENRNTEAVKQEIVRFLNDELRLRSGRMYVNRIFNRAESIFKGFTLDEIDNQFLMQPFCGWRFEGEIEFYDTCAPYIPPVPPIEPQYIRGHFTDGRTTFDFVINGSQTISVDVDKNGWWKWDVDRNITSLFDFCKNVSISLLDYIEFVGVNLDNIRDYQWALGADTVENDAFRVIDMSRCKGAIKSNPQLFAYRAKCLWYMPNIENWSNAYTLQSQSRFIAKGYVKANMNISNLTNLLKNNILSIIEAAAANVTFTLYSAIYAKCARGGEWHDDIQAAINAKAAQGFTVTLISA